ncbi:unnamed protein product [Arabidopsis arenosa]|uniref:RNase H type-1 domain-containing protein n=1 Tax=Arabidopsis arenosa TaxID=38785 RepID=A0A8S2AT52_ARAAE|nr:unnamed protein product [Arabidopsis arenosa]
MKEQEETRRGHSRPRVSVEKWKPPPRGWVKCNTDGTRQGDGSPSGTGWVLRTSDGTVLWMGAKALRRTRSVLEVELEALRWAILTIIRFNYQKVIFESDSLEVVNLINNNESWPSYAPTLQDIKLLLQQFQEAIVIYSPRGCNGVADQGISFF